MPFLASAKRLAVRAVKGARGWRSSESSGDPLQKKRMVQAHGVGRKGKQRNKKKTGRFSRIRMVRDHSKDGLCPLAFRWLARWLRAAASQFLWFRCRRWRFLTAAEV